MRRLFLLILLALPLSACVALSSLSSTSPQSLEGIMWTAVSINGKPVEAFPNQEPPHLVFFETSASEVRVSGSDGCNRLIGTCKFNGEKLTFSPMGSTMMACPFGFEQSQAFKETLARVNSWRIVDNTMELMENGTVILTLR